MPWCEVFDVTSHTGSPHRRLPSETRDFAPTPVGWAGILAGTGGLAMLVWQVGGDDRGIRWLVVSVVIGYFLAAIVWTAIRRELDRR